ncbi:MAG: DUF4258 domain-containing protein [Bacteroidetes bacterium]|nr:DUF4258 domain-containing protein [Bacteroidota bacterium]
MLLSKNERPIFLKRLGFYAFGVVLGIFTVSFLFKGRSGCKLPATLKLEELQSQKIEYSKHATCRMNCRNISKNTVKELLQKGSINYKKSEVQNKPCPKYAVEGTTAQNQHVRIIVADCDSISTIVTAIDLDRETDSCECE